MSVGPEFLANLEACALAGDAVAQDAGQVVDKAGVTAEFISEANTVLSNEVSLAMQSATDESAGLAQSSRATVESAGKMENSMTHTLESTNDASAQQALAMAREARVAAVEESVAGVEGQSAGIEALAEKAAETIGEAALMLFQLQQKLAEAEGHYRRLQELGRLAQTAGATGAEEVRNYIATVKRMLGGSET